MVASRGLACQPVTSTGVTVSLTALTVPAYVRVDRAANAAASELPNLLVRVGFCLVITLIPFGHLYLPGTGERIGAVRISQAVMLLSLFVQPRVCFGRAPFAFFAFAGYVLFRVLNGVVLSLEWQESWTNSTIVLLDSLLLFLFLFNLLRYPGMPRLALWSMAIGASVTALCQAVGIGVTAVNSFETRLSVFGENANVVGLTYSVGLLCLLALFYSRLLPPLFLRLAMLPAAAVLTYGLALTASRGAFLVLAIGFILLAVSSNGRTSRSAHIALVLIALLLTSAVFLTRPVVLNRLLGRAAPPSQGEARARMFPVLWRMFLTKPIVGLGPDAYKYEMTRRALPGWWARGKLISAHNLVLLLLVETGLVGFTIYSLGFLSVGKRAFRAWREHRCMLPLALFIALAVLAILAGVVHYNRVYWLVMAYASAVDNDV
jgi:O-antigen ligase